MITKAHPLLIELGLSASPGSEHRDPPLATPSREETFGVPAPKPDLIVSCAACRGERRSCRACFGSGKLALPHMDEETADGVWEAAYELLTTFGISIHEEAWTYRRINGEWRVVDFTTARTTKDEE